jgi:hypothetical protein
MVSAALLSRDFTINHGTLNPRKQQPTSKLGALIMPRWQVNVENTTMGAKQMQIQELVDVTGINQKTKYCY